MIDLDVPTEVVTAPHRRARVCANCGAVYHVDHPPKEGWTCDVCAGNVVQRADDTEEAVMRRLELYEIETLPLIHFYRRRGQLAHVDGQRRQRRGLRPRFSDRRVDASPAKTERGMITRKSPDQIALMRKAGKVVAEMHEECIRATKPGATTLDVDAVAREVIERRGARSNFLNYHGFPAVVCTSPNHVIVHGIPSADVVLEDGDILSIDCGAIIEGWHADAAVTVPVGDIDDESSAHRRHPRLARCRDRAGRRRQAARRRRRRGRRQGRSSRVHSRPGVRGHGIGTAMHEEPQIPNYGPAGRGMKLKEGHVVAIEPMVNAGGPETKVLEDGWTVITRDGRRSAHFEHTIAVTDTAPRS